MYISLKIGSRDILHIYNSTFYPLVSQLILCYRYSSTLLLFSFCNLWLFNDLNLNFSIYKKWGCKKYETIASKSMNNENIHPFLKLLLSVEHFFIAFVWAYTTKLLFHK